MPISQKAVVQLPYSVTAGTTVHSEIKSLTFLVLHPHIILHIAQYVWRQQFGNTIWKRTTLTFSPISTLHQNIIGFSLRHVYVTQLQQNILRLKANISYILLFLLLSGELWRINSYITVLQVNWFPPTLLCIQQLQWLTLYDMWLSTYHSSLPNTMVQLTVNHHNTYC